MEVLLLVTLLTSWSSIAKIVVFFLPVGMPDNYVIVGDEGGGV